MDLGRVRVRGVTLHVGWLLLVLAVVAACIGPLQGRLTRSSTLRPGAHTTATVPSSRTGRLSTAITPYAADTPLIATMTPVIGAFQLPAADPAVTPTPLPPTLGGGENDQSTWQEYRLQSWGLAFRYPQQWGVSVAAPQAPGQLEYVEVAGGGRALRLMKQVPGHNLDAYERLEPIAVGPVKGDKFVGRGPEGQLLEAIVVPQARRDAIALIQYQLLGGEEDPMYMALFDAVLATLRFDVGATPAGPERPFAVYKPRDVSLPSTYRGYALPLDLAQVEGLDSYGLTPDERDALSAGGFFVAPGDGLEFSSFYQGLRGTGKPIFVTTDSALHVYQVLFDNLLRSAERDHLAGDLLSLSRQLLATAQATYQDARGTPVEDAALRTLAYFAVGVRLQDPQAQLPSAAKDLAERELALIAAHEGVASSPLLEQSGGAGYQQDYSVYAPRGHYAESEGMGRYYQAMTWYGGLNLRLERPGEARMALLITQALQRARVGGRAAWSVWESIYEPTTFFLGRTDDLNVYDIRNLATSVYGGLGDGPGTFSGDAQLASFARAAAELPAPRINPMPFGADRDGRGFRLMGQRAALDGYVFDQLLYDRVGTVDQPRLLPRGLDLAAAMGSEEASRALDDLGDTGYARYPERLAAVREEVASLPGGTWRQDLSWAWLYALQPLLATKDARYPEFMRTPAWARRDLQTMLASWTEQKHDTVVYAKQPSGPAAAMAQGPSPGYVEPDPEVYARLAALAEMARTGLDSRALLGAEGRRALQRVETLAERLQAIAEKELAGSALSADDQAFVQGYGGELDALIRAAAEGEGPLPDSQAAIVADVATGGAEVLEEATGRIAHLYVVVQSEGRLVLAEGGVYSYYEFPWPSSERLTDDKWRTMLGDGQVPPQPVWMRAFTVD